MNLSSIRPHYLLKIDSAAISFGGRSFNEGVPASVRRELEETNFVVRLLERAFETPQSPH
jgi:hypothetical protein